MQVTVSNGDDRSALRQKPGLTGAQAVALVIAQQTKPVVYGIPGGYTVYIYDALWSLKDEVKTLIVRQEALATVMAEAQGRLTGQPAFVIAQGAWVLGNAGVGVMEAHLGASPMVLLIDATDGGSYAHLGPYQAGFGGYGACDLPAAMKAITKRTFVATDATQAMQMTQLAIKHAVTGEPGPVAVIFTGKSLAARVNSGAEPQSYLDRSYVSSARPAALNADLEAAEEVIRSASRPVIIAGNGVRLAAAERKLVNLARSANIPVATTPAGKGTFPENDELALGLIGGFGHDTANAVVGAADVVIAIGTKLGATDTANANRNLIDLRRQKLVQIDVEPLNLSWTFPADVIVQGDAADVLPRLQAALSGYTGAGDERVAKARAAHPYFNRQFTSKPGAMSGRDVVSVLAQELPDETVATCDAGENRLFMLREFQSKEGGTVLQPNGGGGMGYAIPAAMGAAVNFPGRSIVAVCGDGGFSMTLHGLLTAIELKLTMIVVVLDNGVLGWVYNGQRGRTIASELKNFDYAAIAKSIGCFSTKVESIDDVRQAIKDARGREGVSVIVAKTVKTDRYQDMLASLNSHDVYAVPEIEDPDWMHVESTR